MGNNINFENISVEDLTGLWNEQKKELEKQKLFRKQLLEESLKYKTRALAPHPYVKLFFVAIVFLFSVAYTLSYCHLYWPVPALCLFAIPNILWNKAMRSKMSSMDGGIAGMQENLIKYKKGLRLFSVCLWLILVPYLFWFFHYLHMELSMSATLSYCIIAFTGIAGLTAFVIRLRTVNKGLRSLEEIRNQLTDL